MTEKVFELRLDVAIMKQRLARSRLIKEAEIMGFKFTIELPADCLKELKEKGRPELNSFQVPEQACPSCFTKLDAATNADGDAQPKPGDFTICIKCRSVLRFDPGMGVYIPSPEEMRELTLGNLKLISRIQQAIVTMRAQRN